MGVGGPRQLVTGHSNRINAAHLPGAPVVLNIFKGKTFLFITHYETDYEIHMELKYKLQISEEILAYSWPFWATTSSHPPPARNHMRVFSWQS